MDVTFPGRTIVFVELEGRRCRRSSLFIERLFRGTGLLDLSCTLEGSTVSFRAAKVFEETQA